MAERFFEALMNDEVILSSLSQIGLLSLIIIVSFFLEHSVEKSFEKQESNKKEELYAHDDVITAGLVSIFAFIISSLLLFGEIFRVFLRLLIILMGMFS